MSGQGLGNIGGRQGHWLHRMQKWQLGLGSPAWVSKWWCLMWDGKDGKQFRCNQSITNECIRPSGLPEASENTKKIFFEGGAIQFNLIADGSAAAAGGSFHVPFEAEDWIYQWPSGSFKSRRRRTPERYGSRWITMWPSRGPFWARSQNTVPHLQPASQLSLKSSPPRHGRGDIGKRRSVADITQSCNFVRGRSSIICCSVDAKTKQII